MASMLHHRPGLVRVPLSIVVAVLLAACDGDDPTTVPPEARVPTSIEFAQEAVSVDDGSSVQVSVTVRDQDGQTLTSLPEGSSVAWSVADGSVASAQAAGAGLQAEVTGVRPGSTQVTASIGSLSAQASVAVNQVATELELVSGDDQTGAPGGELGEPLAVRVVDRHGDGVPGVTVTFEVTSGGGSVSEQSVSTDAAGDAETVWTLGPAEGEQTAEARATGLASSPIEFRATAGEARVPTSIEFAQEAIFVDDGSSVLIPVTVRDQDGQALTSLPEGSSISWSVADDSIASVQAVGAGLQAEVTGERPGSTQVTASIGSLSAHVSVAVNQVATELDLVSGDDQTGAAGGELGEPLAVRVIDRHGEGVPGVTVTFEVTSGGGSVSEQSVSTDAAGDAETIWTLGPAEGEQTVEARATGLAGSPIEFRATAGEQTGLTGTVEGVVTSANGMVPIQGALVRLAASAAIPEGGLFVGSGAEDIGHSSHQEPYALTDVDGRFVLENVPEGEQVLWATRGVFHAEVSVNVLPNMTVQSETFQLDVTGGLAYVPGEFDAIEDIVRAELGTELDEISVHDLANPEVTSRYQFIFINCGMDFGFDEGAVVSNLRDYLSGGGALYISDLEAWLVEDIFPEDIVEGFGGIEGTITARVVSSDLRSFLPGSPETVAIAFNLSGWSAVHRLSDVSEILLTGSWPSVQDGPLAISITHGEGQLVYTSFHNNAAATADQVAVLMYFIYGFGGEAAGGAPALDLSTLRLDSGTAAPRSGEPAREHRRPERPRTH